MYKRKESYKLKITPNGGENAMGKIHIKQTQEENRSRDYKRKPKKQSSGPGKANTSQHRERVKKTNQPG